MKENEGNIIAPPSQFRDKPKSVPKFEENMIPPTAEFRDQSLDETGITKLEMAALKGDVRSYTVNIKYQNDPLLQLHNTEKGIETHLKKLLDEMKGFKLVETLKVIFKTPLKLGEKIEKDAEIKQNEFGLEYKIKSAYFNSKPLAITNDTNIKDTLGLATQ